MSAGRIAGHLFDSLDRCSCGRRWLDICHVDTSYAGVAGIAHYGNLDHAEAYEIVEERERRERLLADATKEVGS